MQVEALPSWTCTQLRSGATCKSSASDWGSVVRRAAAAQRLEVSVILVSLFERPLPMLLHHKLLCAQLAVSLHMRHCSRIVALASMDAAL